MIQNRKVLSEYVQDGEELLPINDKVKEEVCTESVEKLPRLGSLYLPFAKDKDILLLIMIPTVLREKSGVSSLMIKCTPSYLFT